MRRRVFLSGVFLAGVGLPVLAGCKAPWQSKGQAGSASASASAGGVSARGLRDVSVSAQMAAQALTALMGSSRMSFLVGRGMVGAVVPEYRDSGGEGNMSNSMRPH